jgi:hypothetical protein
MILETLFGYSTIDRTIITFWYFDSRLNTHASITE